jgi:hypothetical protein
MMRNYPLGVILVLYFILLVHFGIEARAGKKNVKSLQKSPWDKVASGVKVTSWLIISKKMTAKIVPVILNFKKMNCGDTGNSEGRLSLNAVVKRSATQI